MNLSKSKRDEEINFVNFKPTKGRGYPKTRSSARGPKRKPSKKREWNAGKKKTTYSNHL